MARSTLTNKQYMQLERTLMDARTSTEALNRAVTQTPFEFEGEMALLFLGFITLFIVDSDNKVVLAAAATDNDYYRQSIANYKFKLSDYRVPLSATDNSVVQAITGGKPISSDNWDSFRRPKVDVGVARLNQASSGIGYTMVYPMSGKVQGALMYNFYQFPEAIGAPHQEFMQKYSDLVSKVLT